MAEVPTIAAQKILVVMPNWLGDAVMATPFLSALRTLYPDAQIAGLARPLVAPVLAGLPFVDETQLLQKSNAGESLRWMKTQRFELAILLPNSFRSAWMAFKARVPNRLGYARDWRSPLLTHRLAAMKRSREQGTADEGRAEAIRRISRDLGQPKSPRVGSAFQPVPTIDYYLAMAQALGAPAGSSRQMQLAVTAEEQGEADSALVQAGIGPDDQIITLVPGANFGSSKCWMPERFAHIADRIMDKQGVFKAHVILAGSPAERPIVEAIRAASALCPGGRGIGRLHATANMNDGKGLSIGALKQIIRRSRLVLCNDTGPRHFAAAFGVPTVTLFGPTDPVWAETFLQNERIVRIDVPCGPCQLKQCPIDHRCMKGITTEMVMQAITDLLHPPEPVEQDIDPRTLDDATT